jgi:hypothetical protein
MNLSEENGKLPIIDSSCGEIARCGGCRGYLSVYCRLHDYRHWTCALCKTKNEMQGDYFQQDPTFCDEGGAMVELKYPVFEYLVPSKYYGS